MEKDDLIIESKGVKVKVRTADGKDYAGYINILGFDRLSDYLQQHMASFIMIYHGGLEENKTIFVSKNNIMTIEEIDEE